MRFIFSAPFRTNITLDSLNAVVTPEPVAKTLASTIQSLQSTMPVGFKWETQWARNNMGELHYSELSEDMLPLSATPILQLTISSDIIISHFVVPGDAIFQIARVDHCFVDYYDNTIAIARIDITLKEPRNKSIFFSSIDRWSTEFCSSIIKLIKPVEKEIWNKLLKNDQKENRGVFLSPGEFTVFFDRNVVQEDALNEREEMLWVTRIFLNSSDLSKSDLSNLLENWTQQSNLSAKTIMVGHAHIAFCVGNSVVFDTLTDEEELAINKSLSLCTYFYVIYDVLNQNLRKLYLKISKDKLASASAINNLNITRSHIEFIENEFSDVLMGLQGLRKNVSSILLKTWSYADLVEAVQRKKSTVGKLVDFLLQNKQNRYNRLIESVLAAIGGVTLLDFTLNLFSFSNSTISMDDSIPGLVDAARHLSVDGTLYTIIIFLVFVLLLVIKKR